jgi:hypothetical protein
MVLAHGTDDDGMKHHALVPVDWRYHSHCATKWICSHNSEERCRTRARVVALAVHSYQY